MARMAYLAPAWNFVSRTMTRTTRDIVAPTALMTRERRMCARALGSVSCGSRRFQWRIMPVWLSVNETKTPTMYSWISWVTSAW